MLLLGLGVFIFIFFCIMEKRSKYSEGGNVLWGLFFWAAFVLIGSGIISVNSPPAYRVAMERQIVALADDSRIGGQFGLFSGVINEESYYIYYYDSGNGVIKQDKVKVEDAVIIEGDEDPVLEKHVDAREGWGKYNIWFKEAEFYEFHVPRGTVVRQFNLDLDTQVRAEDDSTKPVPSSDGN